MRIDAGDLRLPRGRYAGFWSALVHVVRNAIDHGIEDAASRASAGKSTRGTVSFRARAENGHVAVEIEDDGAGVDWDALAAKARASGMDASSRDALARAMFASGVSSAARVTDVSGRGVGLAAVKDSVAALGGTVRVESD